MVVLLTTLLFVSLVGHVWQWLDRIALADKLATARRIVLEYQREVPRLVDYSATIARLSLNRWDTQRAQAQRDSERARR